MNFVNFFGISDAMSGYFVSAAPAILFRSFGNFAGVFSWSEDVHVV